MGNSASNALNPPGRTIRAPSPSPSPGHPHPSLRTKKKSLELPDLASLSLAQNNHTRGREKAKTASIPIPTSPVSPFNHYQQAQQTQPQRAPRHLPSTADVNLVVSPHHNRPPFPPAPRQNPSAPRGRQQPISSRQQQQQVARMQELYNQSQQPTNSPARQSPFQHETVRSSIPVALTKALPHETPSVHEILQQEYPQKEDLLADFVPVKIVWKGGGNQVVLARAGDDEWKGRQPMEKESANVWTLTVMLRPGTHHVRFLVDGQWRVADDIPAAVDDQGSLANYVAVPIPASLSLPPPLTRDKLIPGQSFWSADSSADGESEHHQHQQSQARQSQQTSPTHNHTSHSQSAKWTDVLPPELIEAAREEEVYLSASAGQYESNTRVTTGFVPAPNIPPAPGLPRHLEKLILNTRVSALSGGVGSGSSGAAGGGTCVVRPGSGQAMGGVGAMGIGSGQGQAARKERRDRERDGDRERRDGDRRERERDRERDRDRDRDRATRRRAPTASTVLNVPPAPPPSEVGGDSSLVLPTPLATTAVELVESSLTSPTQPPSIFTNTNTTATTPQTSLPTTPVAPMSPIQGKTYENGNGNGTESSPTRSPTIQHTIPSASTSTSANASANASATASPNPNFTYPFSPSTPIPSSASAPPSTTTTTYPYTTPSGSRSITIDTSNMPALSDDGSVLPVPSHVVLHHLSTSAIRNGVLAVGNTIRYRKKYLTTIYYKPT